MKLVDLHPKWHDREDGRRGVGLEFDCPVHGNNETCKNGGLLFIPFENPLDGSAPIGKVGWKRTGDTFETLTLTPSIKWGDWRTGGEHWHGHITKGLIVKA